MKILHVVPYYLPATRYGGPIRSVHGLCRALVALGHEVHVFTTNVDGPGCSNVPLNEIVELEGVKIHYFKTNFLKRLFCSMPMKVSLQKNIENFDIVHLHTLFLWPTFFAARLAKKKGIPYVVTPRGMLVKELIQKKSKWVKTVWLSIFEKKTLSEASYVHVTSDVELEEIKKFNFNLKTSDVIPNGIDIEKDSQDPESSIPDKIKLKQDDKFILYLGRLSWKKRIDLVIDSMRYIDDAHLVIAGNDEEGLTGKLMQQVEKLNLKSRVHFIGSVDDSEKTYLMKRASVFVLLSYSENFGIVVLEAMLNKCPVVVTQEVGLSSVVSENGCGFVASDDPKKVAHLISSILNDNVLGQKMGQSGYNAVLRGFSWSAIAKLMEKLYFEIKTSERKSDHD